MNTVFLGQTVRKPNFQTGFLSDASYQQTNARLYRQGQKESVRIFHLVCKDTIDEDILAALEKKDASQNRLIEAVKADLRR